MGRFVTLLVEIGRQATRYSALSRRLWFRRQLPYRFHDFAGRFGPSV